MYVLRDIFFFFLLSVNVDIFSRISLSLPPEPKRSTSETFPCCRYLSLYYYTVDWSPDQADTMAYILYTKVFLFRFLFISKKYSLLLLLNAVRYIYTISRTRLSIPLDVRYGVI